MEMTSLPDFSQQHNSFQYSEEKLEKSRERNREHAKQTRLRKKNLLDSMKNRLTQLQEQSVKLQQLLDEKSTASILLCLSGPETTISETDPSSESFEAFKGDLVDHLKHSVRQESARKRKDNSSDDEGSRSKLSRRGSMDSAEYSDTDPSQDEKARKERNRMHAKLTRDRKKLFTAKISETISQLEIRNRAMLEKLLSIQSVDTQSKSSSSFDFLSVFPISSGSPREIWNDINTDILQSV